MRMPEERRHRCRGMVGYSTAQRCPFEPRGDAAMRAQLYTIRCLSSSSA